MQITANAPSASGRNRPPSNGAALEVLRGNDAGRGKPRLYKMTTGPFAGACWARRDAVTGIAGYGFRFQVDDHVEARQRAYDQWDIRTTAARPRQGSWSGLGTQRGTE